jgi:aryl-alcohol dehydrogenase-like predicted oxidoreductase
MLLRSNGLAIVVSFSDSQAFQGVPREKFQIATKFGIYHENGQRVLRADPKQVRESVEGSLKRLCVNYIDLYYQHRVDPKTPIEITVSNRAF